MSACRMRPVPFATVPGRIRPWCIQKHASRGSISRPLSFRRHRSWPQRLTQSRRGDAPNEIARRFAFDRVPSDSATLSSFHPDCSETTMPNVEKLALKHLETL